MASRCLEQLLLLWCGEWIPLQTHWRQIVYHLWTIKKDQSWLNPFNTQKAQQGLPIHRSRGFLARSTGRGHSVCAWLWNCVLSSCKEEPHFLKQPVPIMTWRKRMWSTSSLKWMETGPAPCVHTPSPTRQGRVGVLPALLTIGLMKLDIGWVNFSLQGEFQDSQNKYKNYILTQIHSDCSNALSGLILENFLNFLSHLRQTYHRKILAETWSKNIFKLAWMSCKCSVERMLIHR